MNLMRFFRYIVTGLVANGLGLAVFQGLVWAGAAPEAASLLATFPAVLTAYLLNKLWSFKSALPHGRVIIRYGLATVTTMVLQIAIVSVLYRLFGVWPFAAQLFALGVATPFSYLLMTFWVFASVVGDQAVGKAADSQRPHL
jgi:putative flippase GtrA